MDIINFLWTALGLVSFLLWAQFIQYRMLGERKYTLENNRYNLPMVPSPRVICAALCRTPNLLPDPYEQKSPAHQVRDHMRATGTMCDSIPNMLTNEEVRLLVASCVSDLVKLARTVCDSPGAAAQMVKDAVHADEPYVQPYKFIDCIAEQAQAACSIEYNFRRIWAECGVNLDAVFSVMQAADDAKRFPDGTFHKNERGELQTPPGWQAPNVSEEISRQITEGPWPC